MVGHTHLFVIKIMPFRDEIVDIERKNFVKRSEDYNIENTHAIEKKQKLDFSENVGGKVACYFVESICSYIAAFRTRNKTLGKP